MDNTVVCECSYEQARKVILEEIGRGCKKFAIYPYGKYGHMAEEILKQQGEVSYIVLDEKLADNVKVHRLNTLDAKTYWDYTILLCSNSIPLYSQLRRALRQYAQRNKVVDVCLRDSEYAMGFEQNHKRPVRSETNGGVVSECSYEQVREVILGEIAGGCRKFAIYPYRAYGHMAEEILKQHGDVSYVVLDEMLADDEKIHGLSILNREAYWDYTVLLCSNSIPFYSELRGELARYAIRNTIVDVCLQDSLFAMLRFREPRLAALECAAREIRSRRIEGSVAEAGVFRGDFAQHINLFFPQKKLYLIDTFEGFDEKDIAVDLKEAFVNNIQDWSDTGVQVVLRKMKHEKNCIVKKGFFPDVMKDTEDTFCFVSLDMDLYRPTYEGLHYFYPRLNKGGYIFVHDCRNLGYLGARKAVMDFCAEEGIGYVPLQDHWGTAVITK